MMMQQEIEIEWHRAIWWLWWQREIRSIAKREIIQHTSSSRRQHRDLNFRIKSAHREKDSRNIKRSHWHLSGRNTNAPSHTRKIHLNLWEPFFHIAPVHFWKLLILWKVRNFLPSHTCSHNIVTSTTNYTRIYNTMGTFFSSRPQHFESHDEQYIKQLTLWKKTMLMSPVHSLVYFLRNNFSLVRPNSSIKPPHTSLYVIHVSLQVNICQTKREVPLGPLTPYTDNVPAVAQS